MGNRDRDRDKERARLLSYTCMMFTCRYICVYVYAYRGPKLGTYSDWGLSSILVINKHLSHHHRICICMYVYIHRFMNKGLIIMTPYQWQLMFLQRSTVRKCVCVYASAHMCVCACVCVYVCVWVCLFVSTL